MGEIRLMKGNEALAEAAIRCGCDAYFGYPITPQSEVLEYLASQTPEKLNGMIVLQAESEPSAINMVYGAAGCGKKVMISSSSPGISLMQEGLSYIAGAELPCLVVNVMRGGPGLGTIQPSQADYFQAVKGGGHGDYKLIVLAPSSVQEMCDFVPLSFDLAFKYRNPVMILSDGMIGQMMEKVELFDPIPRSIDIPVWATTGKRKDRPKNVITSIHLHPWEMEEFNIHLQKKYNRIKENEVRYEEIETKDAEYIIVSFGSAARISHKVVKLARANGIKLGLIRPITLFPFPDRIISEFSKRVKGILVVELNAGQMVEDVRLSVEGRIPVYFYGRMGGMIPTPEEILSVIEEKLKWS